jgi:hypothetical protein
MDVLSMWDEQQVALNQEIAAGLEHLRKQERVWFNWVCRLHDVHAGLQTPQSAAILAVARRRWADARRALERAEGQASAPPDSFGQGASRAQPSDSSRSSD